MNKKLLILTTALVALSAAPVFAKNDNANANAQNHANSNGIENSNPNSALHGTPEVVIPPVVNIPEAVVTPPVVTPPVEHNNSNPTAQEHANEHALENANEHSALNNEPEVPTVPVVTPPVVVPELPNVEVNFPETVTPSLPPVIQDVTFFPGMAPSTKADREKYIRFIYAERKYEEPNLKPFNIKYIPKLEDNACDFMNCTGNK